MLLRALQSKVRLVTSRLFVPLTVAAFLVALGVIAATCGDGDELTLREYFRQIHEAEDRFEASLDEEFRFIVNYRELVDALEGINAPAKVELAHEELVDAHTEAMGLASGELSGDIYAANDRVIQACLNLQGTADANRVDVDLECTSRKSRGASTHPGTLGLKATLPTAYTF